MQSRIITTVFALLLSTAPALAQEAGGLGISPQFMGQGAIKGLARPLLSANIPFITARDVQNGMTAADHQTTNQNAITKLRGDAGFLAGFQFGQPLALSRQQPVQDQGFGFDGGFHRRHRHDPQPIIINNEGPLAITNGNGNLVQQQSSTGALGPVAQQQVATTVPGGSGGALNLVTGGGNIIQRSPR
jgi:hypothetical protein